MTLQPAVALSSVGYQRLWDLAHARRGLVQYQLASILGLVCTSSLRLLRTSRGRMVGIMHHYEPLSHADFRILVNAGPGFCNFLFLQLQPDL